MIFKTIYYWKTVKNSTVLKFSSELSDGRISKFPRGLAYILKKLRKKQIS